MLYPKISNIKQSKHITNILFILSLCLSAILMLINYTCNSKLNWSIIVIVSIAYVWISTIYALDKSVNLAEYTFYEMIEISILLFIIDFVFGFKKWSFSIGIPIVIIVTNLTMMIITIIKHKKYVNYAIYEIIILVFSIVYNIIISYISVHSPLMNIITLWISITNLSFVLVLNAKVLKLEFQKKFHL